MSPSALRKNSSSVVPSPRQKRRGNNCNEDERGLIMPSPTDSEHNSILNGNDLIDSGGGGGGSSPPEIGFSLPKLKKSSKVSETKRVRNIYLIS